MDFPCGTLVGLGKMDNRNAQMYMEDTIKSPGAQPSPGLRTARKSAGVEPAISGVNQVRDLYLMF